MGTHPIFESDFDCLTETGRKRFDSCDDVDCEISVIEWDW